MVTRLAVVPTRDAENLSKGLITLYLVGV